MVWRTRKWASDKEQTKREKNINEMGKRKRIKTKKNFIQNEHGVLGWMMTKRLFVVCFVICDCFDGRSSFSEMNISVGWNGKTNAPSRNSETKNSVVSSAGVGCKRLTKMIILMTWNSIRINFSVDFSSRLNDAKKKTHTHTQTSLDKWWNTENHGRNEKSRFVFRHAKNIESRRLIHSN